MIKKINLYTKEVGGLSRLPAWSASQIPDDWSSTLKTIDLPAIAENLEN